MVGKDCGLLKSWLCVGRNWSFWARERKRRWRLCKVGHKDFCHVIRQQSLAKLAKGADKSMQDLLKEEVGRSGLERCTSTSARFVG